MMFFEKIKNFVIVFSDFFKKNYWLILASFSIATFIFFLFNTQFIKPVFCQSSYWIILIFSLLFFFFSFRQCQSYFEQFDFKENISKSFLIAIIFTGIVAISVPHGFRVLSDETNLLAVAKSFHLDRDVYNNTIGLWYYDTNHDLNEEIPKRPLLFPFFVSLLHTVFGYNPKNVFILNTICLFLLLLIVAEFSRRRQGIVLAFAAVLFVLSQPILTSSANSAGFDVFSTLFHLLSFLGLWNYLQRSTGENLIFLSTTLILFAHTRYESIIHLPIFAVGIVLAAKKMFWPNIKEYAFFYGLSWISLIPIFTQRYLNQGKYENPKDVPVLSFERFLEHSAEYLRSQIDLNFELPYATILNLISWLLIFCLLFDLVKKVKKKEEMSVKNKIFFSVFVSSMLIGLVIFLAHHAGRYGHPTQSRFFITNSLLLSMIPIFSYGILKSITPKGLLLGGILSFFVYHPLAVSDEFSNKLLLIRQTNYLLNFFEKIGRKDFLIVIDRPGQYTVFNYSAYNFSYAKDHEERVLHDLERALYNEIYVVQDFSYSNNKPESDQELNENFPLIELERMQNTGDEYFVISKVDKKKLFDRD